MRSRGSRGKPPSQPPDLSAALTLAQTGEVCRARQAQGSSRLQASTCGETGSEPTPSGNPALPSAAHSPAARVRETTRRTPSWPDTTRDSSVRSRRKEASQSRN